MASTTTPGTHPRKTMATAPPAARFPTSASGGAGGSGATRSFSLSDPTVNSVSYAATPAATTAAAPPAGGNRHSLAPRRSSPCRNRPASRRSAFACSACSATSASRVSLRFSFIPNTADFPFCRVGFKPPFREHGGLKPPYSARVQRVCHPKVLRGSREAKPFVFSSFPRIPRHTNV